MRFLKALALICGLAAPSAAGQYFNTPVTSTATGTAWSSQAGPFYLSSSSSNVSATTANVPTKSTWTVVLDPINLRLGIGSPAPTIRTFDAAVPEAVLQLKSNGSTGGQNALIILDDSTSGGGGHAQVRFSRNGAPQWSEGADSSDGNKYKVTAGVVVGGPSTATVYSTTGQALCGPAPYYDVRCYGLVGDGVTNNDAAWASLYAAIPSTGIVYFPRGTYLLTSITIKDKFITLKGDGGTSAQWGGGATTYYAASVIKSTTTTGPIVSFTTLSSPYNPLNNYITAMQDISVQGSAANILSQANAQDCIFVGQQGLNFINVAANYCGGSGWNLANTVTSHFINCQGNSSNYAGVYINDRQLSYALKDVTDNVFEAFIAIGNAGDGFHFYSGGQGTQCNSCLVQSNGGYEFNLSGEGEGGTGLITGVKFTSTWDEVGGFGGVHCSSNTSNVDFDFVHHGDTDTIDAQTYNCRISVSYDATNNQYEANGWIQPSNIRNASGNSSGDNTATKIRNNTGNGYGAMIGAAFTAYSGTDIIGGGNNVVNPSTVPYVFGNFNVGANGYGIVAENIAKTGNYQLIASDTNNGATFSGEVTFSSAAVNTSQTIAQLLAKTPGVVGMQQYCSNCSPPKLVISTGTSAGNWADAIGGTFK